jgi:hypothetical protein
VRFAFSAGASPRTSGISRRNTDNLDSGSSALLRSSRRIPNSGIGFNRTGCSKIRVTADFRLIYFYRQHGGLLVPVALYAKNERANMAPDEVLRACARSQTDEIPLQLIATAGEQRLSQAHRDDYRFQ